ncbi:hypothetical protein BH24ACT4_BH24ACT4_09630 [soil metagenome]
MSDPVSARGFRLAVAAMTAAALIFHLVASWPVDHPSVVFDETGYLGNARWLAGAGAGWDMPTAPHYAIGYPLVLAPVTRLFTEADAQWRAILAVNAALLASLVPLLVLVARRVLGATRTQALVAAAVGALAPAVVAAGVSAIAENLALPLVPASLLALHATTRRRPGPTGFLFGPTIALLYATHARFVVAVAVGLAVLAVGARQRLIPPAVAAVNAALLVGGTIASVVATRAVEAARWTHVENLEGGVGEVRSLVTSPSGVGELAMTSVGQAWYLAAGSLGLTVVGVAGLVTLLRARAGPGGDRSEEPPTVAPTAAIGPGAGTVDLLAIGFLLALAVGVFGASVAFFAQNQFRADHLVYGRHNDSFTPLWLVAAILTIARTPRPRLRQLFLLAGGTTVALFGVLSLTRDPGGLGGRYSAFAVPAIIRYVAGDPPGTFWRATVAGLVGLTIVSLVGAVMRRPVVLVPALVVWFAWAGFGTVSATAGYQDTIYQDWNVPAEVRRLEVEGISIDVRSVEAAFPALSYPFHLPDVRFTTFDPAFGEGPDQELVLARPDDPTRQAEGDRIALIDGGGFYPFWDAPDGVALWVRPGPEQDRLAEAGLLLPPGYPTGLPQEARRAELEIVGGLAGTEVAVAPGGSVQLDLRGRHIGSGSPWPGRGDNPARVRIAAHVTPLDPDGPEGAVSGGPLPGWTVPGEAFEATAEVFAVDGVLGPLPPGRYRVDLSVTQEQPTWRTDPGSDPGSSFTMVVTDG